MTEYKDLNHFFSIHRKAALAFSGGVDSACLLAEALDAGAEIKAYFVKSRFQPDFELADARRVAAALSADFQVIECDVLAEESIRSNPQNRCYYCKNRIFGALLRAAAADGFDTVIDGTNASDDVGDRPGMQALSEMKVLSPLRLCGISKEEVRARSKARGLFNWNKPAYACLATRIPCGEEITEEKLRRIELSENALFEMGFSDFRVRLFHGGARLQLPAGQMQDAVARRAEIRERLAPHFDLILMDLEER